MTLTALTQFTGRVSGRVVFVTSNGIATAVDVSGPSHLVVVPDQDDECRHRRGRGDLRRNRTFCTGLG